MSEAFEVIYGLQPKPSCLVYCKRSGYAYAGLRGNVCLCSSFPSDYGFYGENTSGGCTFRCFDYNGYGFGSCGGPGNLVSVYSTTLAETAQDWSGIKHWGCYHNPTRSGLLIGHPDTYTPASCTLYCRYNGYAVAAFSEGWRCSCGSNRPSTLVTQDNCAATCLLKDPISLGLCTTGCGGSTDYYDYYSTGCGTGLTSSHEQLGCSMCDCSGSAYFCATQPTCAPASPGDGTCFA